MTGKLFTEQVCYTDITVQMYIIFITIIIIDVSFHDRVDIKDDEQLTTVALTVATIPPVSDVTTTSFDFSSSDYFPKDYSRSRNSNEESLGISGQDFLQDGYTIFLLPSSQKHL